MGCLPFLPALTEARDIYTHLAPLRRQLEDLESLEFPDVKPRLRPLLHVVCLIWATCESYRCPGRLTVLLQEICNLLVQQVGTQQSPTPPRELDGPSHKKSRVCTFFFQSNNEGPKRSPLVAQMVKNLPAMQETQVQSLDLEDPLEKGIATHSSILAWRIPWTEEPGRLQSMESQRVRHD